MIVVGKLYSGLPELFAGTVEAVDQTFVVVHRSPFFGRKVSANDVFVSDRVAASIAS